MPCIEVGPTVFWFMINEQRRNSYLFWQRDCANSKSLSCFKISSISCKIILSSKAQSTITDFSFAAIPTPGTVPYLINRVTGNRNVVYKTVIITVHQPDNTRPGIRQKSFLRQRLDLLKPHHCHHHFDFLCFRFNHLS